MDGNMYVTHPPHLSVSNRQMFGIHSSSKRVYQVWKGSNRFFVGGRLVFGPDARSLVFTVLLIVAPVILFSVFVSSKLVAKFSYYVGNLIVAIAVLFSTYILCLLFLASSRDPGIIPRNKHPPEPEDYESSSNMPTDLSENQGSAIPTIRPTKEILVNGVIIKTKYCQTCMLYRPPRCSHCSICNNCVERFDHHCPWVGQCIGKRNYRLFFMFVSSTTMLCLYVFSFCWVYIKYIMDLHQCNIWRAFLKSPVAGVLILYTFIAAWFVGGLTGFHIYLIVTNQTTYENFRSRYEGSTNPYNRGVILNIKELLFSNIPPSKNDFRAQVTEDSSAFALSNSMGRALSPDMAKRSVDLEMGGKRLPVDAKEFEEMQNQMGVDGSRDEPGHETWDRKSNWEITPDIEALAAEFGMQHGFSEREKMEESH